MNFYFKAVLISKEKNYLNKLRQVGESFIVNKHISNEYTDIYRLINNQGNLCWLDRKDLIITQIFFNDAQLVRKASRIYKNNR
jgi:hypothetical protein